MSIRSRLKLISRQVQYLGFYEDKAAWQVLGRVLRQQLGPNPRTVGFYPELPYRESVEFKLLAVLKYKLVLLREPCARSVELGFRRSDTTVYLPSGDDSCVRGFINGRCDDISKTRVSRVFEEVFGYPIQVDPMTHQGPMLVKPDANASGKPRVVQGPVERGEPGMVYQIYVEAADPDWSVEYRVPYHGGRIPLVYERKRAKTAKFKQVDAARVMEPEDAFSSEELQRLGAVGAEMNLDFGEMDVMRSADGRIYVFDVNNTPSGPEKGFTPQEQRQVVGRLAASFSMFLDEWKKRQRGQR